jgi:type II secretory pathway component PulF
VERLESNAEKLGFILSELMSFGKTQSEIYSQVKSIYQSLYEGKDGHPAITQHLRSHDERICNLEKVHETQEEKLERVKEEQGKIRKAHYWDIVLIIITAIITSFVGYFFMSEGIR